MEALKKLRCLNASHLKIIAMVLMLCDHIWATVVPGARWLTDLGRLAFPIFAFQIAEGFIQTHNFKKYLGRMFLAAVLTEIPFNLMYAGDVIFPFHQNVLWTFCISLLLLRLIRWGRERGHVAFAVTAVLAVVLGYGLGFVLFVDYYGFGVLTVLIFYLFRTSNFRLAWLCQLIALTVINGELMGGMTIPVLGFGLPQQLLAVLALIPIWMYNGERGRLEEHKAFRYGCYAFYPVHMLILYFLSEALDGVSAVSFWTGLV